MDGNPYAPPNDTNDSPRPEYAFDRRCAFLCLPPSIPLIVHAIVRLSIPVEETLYHGLFTLGAIIPSWFWSQTMIDRLRLSMWKTFLVTKIGRAHV